MGIQVSRAHALMNEALNYRSARQDMIASNIANADTPFYRPRDISFQDHLSGFLETKQEVLLFRRSQPEVDPFLDEMNRLTPPCSHFGRHQGVVTCSAPLGLQSQEVLPWKQVTAQP